MKHDFPHNFGLVIAYLVPGAVALWGLGYLWPVVRSWFGASVESDPTVGGFLYVTLGSIGAGLLVSAVRWALVDTLYHSTGIAQPSWDFARFPGRVGAFEALVENHYRYYQFYANFLVAMTFAYVAALTTSGWKAWEGGALAHVAIVAMAMLLVLASRDALRKYYSRATMVLRAQRRGR